MNMNERIQFSTQFELSRNGFTPNCRPFPRDIFGDSPYPEEPELESLKYREMGGFSALTAAERDFVIGLAIERGTITDVTEKVLSAIRSGSSALAQGDEISDLYNDTDARRLTTFLWDTPSTVNGARAGGTYTSSTKTIRVSYPFPPKQDTLKSLGSFGTLTFASDLAVHEVTHALQDVLGGGSIPSELREVQAYRTASNPQSINHEWLVSDIVGSKLYEHLDPYMINSAVWFIDRLNALGLSQREIIDIIKNPGAWNPQEGVWESIDQKITELMAERGLDAAGLERLVMKYNLIRSIERKKAVTITGDVLMEEFRVDIQKRRRDEDEERRKNDSRRMQDVRIRLRQF